MKKTVTMIMTAVLLAAGGTASAADYSRYSSEELVGMRGNMRNASREERADYRNECMKRGVALSAGERPGFAGNTKQCRPRLIKEALGLSDSQQKKLQELREKQFASVKTERRDLFVLQNEIRNESLKKNPDNRKIAMLSEKIGRTHATLARIRSDHFQEMATVLNPGQIEKMKTFMENRPTGKSRKMML
jgi:Spy/CpxP family protein refolding chaperone